MSITNIAGMGILPLLVIVGVVGYFYMKRGGKN
jgi:hypothetical protein